jgi:hypothetical protein
MAHRYPSLSLEREIQDFLFALTFEKIGQKQLFHILVRQKRKDMDTVHRGCADLTKFFTAR